MSTDWLSPSTIVLMVQSLIFLVTGIVIFCQLRHQRRDREFRLTHTVWEEIQQIDRILIEKPVYAKFFGTEIPGATDEARKDSVFGFYVLNFAEMLFWLWKKRILPREEWEPWRRSIARWVGSDALRTLWYTQVLPERMYTESFRKYITGQLYAAAALQLGEGGDT